MLYQPEIETMSRDELEQLQLERLKTLVERVSKTIPFYKESFAKAGLSADDITCLDDLAKFPFTTKQDMRDAYPFKILRALRVLLPLLVILRMILIVGAIALHDFCMLQIAEKKQLFKSPMVMVSLRVV